MAFEPDKECLQTFWPSWVYVSCTVYAPQSAARTSNEAGGISTIPCSDSKLGVQNSHFIKTGILDIIIKVKFWWVDEISWVWEMNFEAWSWVAILGLSFLPRAADTANHQPAEPLPKHSRFVWSKKQPIFVGQVLDSIWPSPICDQVWNFKRCFENDKRSRNPWQPKYDRIFLHNQRRQNISVKTPKQKPKSTFVSRPLGSGQAKPV